LLKARRQPPGSVFAGTRVKAGRPGRPPQRPGRGPSSCRRRSFVTRRLRHGCIRRTEAAGWEHGRRGTSGNSDCPPHDVGTEVKHPRCWMNSAQLSIRIRWRRCFLGGRTRNGFAPAGNRVGIRAADSCPMSVESARRTVLQAQAAAAYGIAGRGSTPDGHREGGQPGARVPRLHRTADLSDKGERARTVAGTWA